MLFNRTPTHWKMCAKSHDTPAPCDLVHFKNKSETSFPTFLREGQTIEMNWLPTHRIEIARVKERGIASTALLPLNSRVHSLSCDTLQKLKATCLQPG